MGALGDLWGVTTKILVHWGKGGSEIKILKANGGAQKEKDVPKRAINLSEQLNCFEFTWDFMLNKYQCL